MREFAPRPSRDLSDVTAAILAGGLGTRLRPAVADRPKVLAPVAGRPFVTHLLSWLAAAGVRRTVLLTGWRGEQVRAALGEQYRGMTLAYSQEASPLGTGGALRAAIGLLRSPNVLLLNGDSYCRADLAALAAFHRGRRADAALSLVHTDDGSRFGRVLTSADGRIAAYAEKESASGPGWINAGVYLLERGLLAAIPQGRPVSLERDLLPAWVERKAVYGRRSDAPFLDIGTPESYAAAERFMAEVAGAESRRVRTATP